MPLLCVCSNTRALFSSFVKAPPTNYGYHDDQSTSSPRPDHQRGALFREQSSSVELPPYRHPVSHPPIPSLFDRLPGTPPERVTETRDEWVQRSNQQLDNEHNHFPRERDSPPDWVDREPAWLEQQGREPHVHHWDPPRQGFPNPPYHPDYRDSPPIPHHDDPHCTPNHMGRSVHHAPPRGRNPQDANGNVFSRDDSPVTTPIAPPPSRVRMFNDRGMASLPPIPKIEIKTVSAERLFEGPGSDRPSHVSEWSNSPVYLFQILPTS